MHAWLPLRPRACHQRLSKQEDKLSQGTRNLATKKHSTEGAKTLATKPYTSKKGQEEHPTKPNRFTLLEGLEGLEEEEDLSLSMLTPIEQGRLVR